MATTSTRLDVYYPESDGKPMAESPIHREVMTDLIAILKDWFVANPLAYVSSNEFVYFVEGQPKRNVSPDVWCVRGIDKTVVRHSYMTWLEGGKGPEFVVEVTSRSTRREDRGKKFRLYPDELKVTEYFLFDPLLEYLKPHLQGHRLVVGEYQPIGPIEGRLPGEVLGLHLEADGPEIRLFDPATGQRLLNRLEKLQAFAEIRRVQEAANRQLIALVQDQQVVVRAARQELEQSRSARQDAELARLQAEKALLLSELENERLRQELEALRAGSQPKPKKRK